MYVCIFVFIQAPSSWQEGEDYIRPAARPRLAPGTLVAVDYDDGYRRYAEVVGVSGLPFKRTYKVLESLSGKVRALSPSDVLLPTDDGLAKCALGRRRVGAANAGALELVPLPVYTGTRAPATQTLERPAASAAPTPGKRARLRAFLRSRAQKFVSWLSSPAPLPLLSVPETTSSSETSVTVAAPASGAAVTRGEAVERWREGSMGDKPSAKMVFTKAKLNAVEANWKQWGIKNSMSTAKLNAVSANTKQWGIPPSASGENVIQRHIGNIDPAGMSVHHFVPVSICSHIHTLIRRVHQNRKQSNPARARMMVSAGNRAGRVVSAAVDQQVCLYIISCRCVCAHTHIHAFTRHAH